MTTHYEPHERTLATEIAERLNDLHSLPLHLQFVRQYKEAFLLDRLEQALAMPKHKIKKSRAALYVHLVTKEDRKPRVTEATTEATYHDYQRDRCPACGRESV